MHPRTARAREVSLGVRATVAVRMLPAHVASFVGRCAEVAEVVRLADDARLLTLTGAGGSGKTRLALEAAARIAARGEVAVSWAELASVSAPSEVVPHVAEQLGVREQRAGQAQAALIERLGTGRHLLVLDNCEHVIDPAARLVDALLRACPGLRVLATSREPLAIGGERAWLVPSLATPPATLRDAAQLATFDAVALFVTRAQDASPSFTLTPARAPIVAEICRRLDGLPLAIELAAARVPVLPPEELLARLDDRLRLLTRGARTAVPRHQTLRATIDWSYALLTADEQRLLDRLSVFTGGFTLDAAGAVCADDGAPAWSVLDVLARLVDRSLVAMKETTHGARYHLLETVRQYAAERLTARGEDEAIERRHAEHVAALVRTAAPHLITAQRPPWLERLLAEIDNVRHALCWTRRFAAPLHLEMTRGLCWFWFATGFWSEGRRWAEDALALDAAPPGSLVHAHAAFAGAVIATLQADSVVAERRLEEVVAVARAHGDAQLAAYGNNYLGMAIIQQGRPGGDGPVRDALAWFRAAGDLYGQRLSLVLLGTVHVARRELAAAVPFLEEAVAVARTFGLPREVGIALQMLAWAQLQQDRIEAAAATAREALMALRQDPHYLFLARGTEIVGLLVAHRGDPRTAAQLVGAGEAMRESLGAGMIQTDRQVIGPRVEAMRAALGDAAFAEAWAAGKAWTFDVAIDTAIERASALSSTPAPAPPVVEAARDDAPALAIAALGPLEVRVDGVAVPPEAFTSARARELLVHLACHPGGRTRAAIGLDFWPDASAAQVKNSFHVLLHRLRKALGRPELIVLDDDRYRLDAPRLWFDAEVFERSLRAAGRDIARLTAALALYRGDLLADEPAGDWHLAQAARLRRRHADGLSLLADLQLAQDDLAAAAHTLERLLAVDELHEDAHRRRTLCLARLGQRDVALRDHARWVVRLRGELGAAPTRATLDLVARLQRGEPV